jgi:hypothetical protein
LDHILASTWKFSIWCNFKESDLLFNRQNLWKSPRNSLCLIISKRNKHKICRHTPQFFFNALFVFKGITHKNRCARDFRAAPGFAKRGDPYVFVYTNSQDKFSVVYILSCVAYIYSIQTSVFPLHSKLDPTLGCDPVPQAFFDFQE